MPPAERLGLGEALALGVLHGPAELLPISSSGHTTLVPWLLGWRYVELDSETRKSFEVGLHAGTAAALLIALRGEVGHAARELDARRISLLALSFVPPAVVGLALERPIERRLGTPATIAAGLLAGSAAMAVADRAPQLRTREQAGALDGLALGIAQACALVPGVSRNGATLAAARLRRFRRRDASVLSRHAALPVIAGASALKGVRMLRRPAREQAASRAGIAAGAAASFASTLASARIVAIVERERSLLPWVVYRAALAGVVLARRRADASQQ